MGLVVALVLGLIAMVAVVGDLRGGLGADNRVSPSNADVVTLAVRPPLRPPGPPVSVVVTPANRALVVSWQPPADAGSAPVQVYEAVAQPGGASCVVAAPATTCTITNLNNGQLFTVTVRAFNAAGPGEPSVPSTPVRPRPG